MLDIGGFWQGALVIVPNEHCQLLRLCSERRYSDRGEGGTGGEEIVRLCRAASGQREAASEDDSVHNTPPIIQQPGTMANDGRSVVYFPPSLAISGIFEEGKRTEPE